MATLYFRQGLLPAVMARISLCILEDLGKWKKIQHTERGGRTTTPRRGHFPVERDDCMNRGVVGRYFAGWFWRAGERSCVVIVASSALLTLLGGVSNWFCVGATSQQLGHTRNDVNWIKSCKYSSLMAESSTGDAMDAAASTANVAESSSESTPHTLARHP